MISLEMFGTELRLSIEDLNMEPELRRIGLSFSYGNGSIWIEEGPTPHANLANRLGVGAAISRHLSAGGICLAWPIANNEVQWMEITPRGVQDISDPRR